MCVAWPASNLLDQDVIAAKFRQLHCGFFSRKAKQVGRTNHVNLGVGTQTVHWFVFSQAALTLVVAVVSEILG